MRTAMEKTLHNELRAALRPLEALRKQYMRRARGAAADAEKTKRKISRYLQTKAPDSVLVDILRDRAELYEELAKDYDHIAESLKIEWKNRLDTTKLPDLSMLPYLDTAGRDRVDRTFQDEADWKKRK